jgi:hypothetical protein
MAEVGLAIGYRHESGDRSIGPIPWNALTLQPHLGGPHHPQSRTSCGEGLARMWCQLAPRLPAGQLGARSLLPLLLAAGLRVCAPRPELTRRPDQQARAVSGLRNAGGPKEQEQACLCRIDAERVRDIANTSVPATASIRVSSGVLSRRASARIAGRMRCSLTDTRGCGVTDPRRQESGPGPCSGHRAVRACRRGARPTLGSTGGEPA